MTPFEEFLYWDAKIPGSPADAVTHLVFRGRLVREVFEAALMRQLKKSPRAAQTVREEENGVARWETRAEFLLKMETFLVWREEAWSGQTLEPIDIRRTPGLRFTVFQDAAGERTDVLFQFHHAATDAVGHFLFLEDFFADYGGVSEEKESGEKITSQKTLRAGFAMCVMILGVILRWMMPWRKRVWGIMAAGNVAKRSDRIVPPNDSPLLSGHSASAPFPAAIGYFYDAQTGQTYGQLSEFRFSREETSQILARAKTLGVTMNDLLLAANFRAAARWRKEHGGGTGVIRAAVPINLRSAEEKYRTPGNVVSILFMNRGERACAGDREKLLAGVASEMRRIKRRDGGRLVLHGVQGLHDLRWGKRHPRWGMELYVKRQPRLASFVQSNLGVLFAGRDLPRTTDGKVRLGDAVLEDIHLMAPRTTNVGIFFPLATYAGELRLTGTYDAARMTRAEAEAWIGFLTEEVRFFECGE